MMSLRVLYKQFCHLLINQLSPNLWNASTDTESHPQINTIWIPNNLMITYMVQILFQFKVRVLNSNWIFTEVQLRGCSHMMSVKMGVCRPPFPPLSAKIRNWRTTPLPPLSEKIRKSLTPHHLSSEFTFCWKIHKI